MITVTMVAMVANLATGKKGEEQFTEASVGTTLLYSVLFSLFILFLISLGAARLSYCYNIYTGNSGGTALTGAQTVTVSSISGYNSFMVLVSGASSASAGSQIQIRLKILGE